MQAHSSADADMLAVAIADEAVEIGPPSAAKSYLNIDALLEAAAKSGADAIHPGYGFLAENATFAQRVADAGLAFVGPSADVICRMGDKVAAREAAKAAGVPTVPGSDGAVANVAEGRKIADAIGYPVIIKAAAGGGGRGIRVAEDARRFERLFSQASGEAQAAFGDGGLYVEKVIHPARHVEVQVLGDGTRAVHVFERECSLQRRRQKVWEEAPSAALSEEQAGELCAVGRARSPRRWATRAPERSNTSSTRRRGDFHFIEMNTRIQVEHPVTEMITGIDLVAEMLRIAGGDPASLAQDEIARRGHAIEVRLNAEDPANNFMPAPGTISGAAHPGRPRRALGPDALRGLRVPPFYDSLLGKLIVWGRTARTPSRVSRARSTSSPSRADAPRRPSSRHSCKDPEVQARRGAHHLARRPGSRPQRETT